MSAPAAGERIQKVLSRAGVAARRQAERMLLEGRIRVNGRVVRTPGTKVMPQDRVEVDGREVVRGGPAVYLLLYKPRGCVTTLADPEGRPTVADLLPAGAARVFPVGRLDYNSEGLLLFTNDGELAQALMHPRSGFPKVYQAKVRGSPDIQALQRLRRPFVIAGRRTQQARVEVVHRNRHTVLKVTITEGRKNQVREMCRRVGHPVLRLRRIAYGPLQDPELSPGQCRPLRASEVAALRAAAGVDAARRESRSRPGQRKTS